MRLICLIILAMLWLPQHRAFGATDHSYLTELVEKSRQLKLSERQEWLKLGHYVPNLITPGLITLGLTSQGVHGLVDSPQFYTAPDGKNNPQAELEATLASFYSDIAESNTQQNPQCAFVARYAWLNEQLNFDPQRLPRQDCKRYQQWHAALNPDSLTLIFASAYINSPSSMYGHPLIRVDAKDQNEQTRLLAYAITFAANTDESNGLAFAVNGLFGGYPGVFSNMPYYLKVREYSALENRDLWEYQLNLNAEEIDRVLRHAWELGANHFQYFFFDENCSYHLLGLLQVARPELDMTSEFRWWAIPADTVGAIAKQPNMVKQVVFRPANATVLRHRLRQLSEAERDLVKGISIKRIAVDDPTLHKLPANRVAAVLEASQEYVSYRRALGKNDVADPAGLTHELLTARNRLDVPAQTPDIPTPKTHPDRGHGSSRIALGAGRRDEQAFQELKLRATYHDIMDADDGYARGAQVEFFSLALRHYDLGTTRVEKFTPVSILSLAPRDEFFQSMSWKIAAGWQRTRARTGQEPLAFALDGGIGSAWSNEQDTALWYVLLDGSSRHSHALEKGYALGAGASIGGLFDLTPRWRMHGYLRNTRYLLGQRDIAQTLGLEQRLALSTNTAVRLDVVRQREFKRSDNTGLLSILFYF